MSLTIEPEIIHANGTVRARITVRDGTRPVHVDTIDLASSRHRDRFVGDVTRKLSDPTLAEGLDADLMRILDNLPDEPEPDEPAKPKRRKPAEPAPADALIFDPRNPLPIARAFRGKRYAHPDSPTLMFAGDVFEAWDGSRWQVVETAGLRAAIYAYLERAKKWIRIGDNLVLVDFAPARSNVDNVVDALKAESYLKASAPCWLTDEPGLPDPAEVVAAQNGLLHLTLDGAPRPLRRPTPIFFSPNALDYAIDPHAASPDNWLRFLDAIFPEDAQAIETLQEWFGYVLTHDNRQQKILLMVGPPRSGKGTIARVLSRLIGMANVCGPTMAGLATNFGLWSLIGKQLAIISDARLSGRTDQAIVVERFLAISGGDAVTIDRKNLPPLTMTLSTRFMILTNELPRLSDASGALPNRLIVLTLDQSFLGREDVGLVDRIYPEMGGILLWAIEGWRRLRERGHFVQPDSSADAINEIQDLASPISAFIRDCCVVRPGASVPVADLFDAWGAWCKEQGRDQFGTVQVFGRDLRAAQPGVYVSRPRDGEGERVRAYDGIDLNPSAKSALADRRVPPTEWVP